jgi:hypothetical protein
MVCVVHGLSGSGEGGQEGCHRQGMREVGQWGSGHNSGAPGAARQVGEWLLLWAWEQGGGCGCRAPGVFIRYRQKER